MDNCRWPSRGLVEDIGHLYEPVKEFSVADVNEFTNRYPGLQLGYGALLTYRFYAGHAEIPGLPEHLKTRPKIGEPDYEKIAEEFESEIEKIIFEPALDRLIERQKTSDPRAALKLVTR